MKKIKNIILYFIILSFLYSCGTASDVGKTLRNEKIKTTDEFLVKKRQPLTLPPDYEDLPEPGTQNSGGKNEDKINQILKIPKKQTDTKSSSNVEQSIINEIRK
tara:strand:+ start:1812 stop:2123 length:312 start_codon:yes stop_codon:yes gene_type:complete